MAKMRHYKRSISGVKFGSRTKIFNYLISRIMLDLVSSFWSQSSFAKSFVVSVISTFLFFPFISFHFFLFRSFSVLTSFIFSQHLVMIEYTYDSDILLLKIFIIFHTDEHSCKNSSVTCSEFVTRQVHKSLWNAWRNKSDNIILLFS